MESSDQTTQLTKREKDLLNYWKTLAKDATTKRQTDRWEKLFQDKETRYGYVNSFLDSYLGMQLRVLREQREWSQTELAERAGMKQPRIALLESMNYSAWSVDVLRRLAKAFDLRLVVKFEDFGSIVPQYLDDFDRENLKRRSFNDDIIFNKEKRNALEIEQYYEDLEETEIDDGRSVDTEFSNTRSATQAEGIPMHNEVTGSQVWKQPKAIQATNLNLRVAEAA